MPQLLPELDIDLHIEHEGHALQLQGTGHRFDAKFLTLLALVHFARALWPHRRLLPKGFSVTWMCWKLRYTVK